MSRQINVILQILETRSGYHGFRLTRCSDGKQIEGQSSGGDSNIRAAFLMGPDGWRSDYFASVESITERDLFKLDSYGCQPENLRRNVKEAFGPW